MIARLRNLCARTMSERLISLTGTAHPHTKCVYHAPEDKSSMRLGSMKMIARLRNLCARTMSERLISLTGTAHPHTKCAFYGIGFQRNFHKRMQLTTKNQLCAALSKITLIRKSIFQ